MLLLLAGLAHADGEFDGAFAYEAFGLEFSAQASRQMEFRTFWHDTAYVKQNSVEIEKNAAIGVNTSTPLGVYEAEALFHQIGRADGVGWCSGHHCSRADVVGQPQGG